MAKALPVPGVDDHLPLFVNAERILGTRLAEMLDYEPCLADPRLSFELHQMRIAAKRVRYTMEIFEDVYVRYAPDGARFSEAIGEIKSIQEHLGVLHDADVLVPELTSRLAGLLRGGHGEGKNGEPVLGAHHVDFDACQGLITLCQEMRARRQKHYQKLMEDWDRLKAERFFEVLRGLLAQAARGR